MPALYIRLLFLVFVFTACGSTSRIDHTETTFYPLGTPGHNLVDSAINRTIRPYQNDLEIKMDIILAYSDQVMEKGMPEGLLGNFVADLALEQTNSIYRPTDQRSVDFCFVNNGGLRATLPKGEITKRKIFEVMPFENELIVLTLNGSTTSRLLNFIANKGGMPVSGIRFKIKDKLATEVFIGNTPFDTAKIYKVVTSDYLANGGDNLSFLAEIKEKETLGLKLRDAIIKHLEEKNKLNQTIKVSLDNRISDGR